MANSENTITTAFVNVLRPMREAWRISEQITKPYLNATKKPDVIVTEGGRNPVVIEVKIDGDSPNLSGQPQAEAHFGMLLDPSVFTELTYPIVENVLRVRMPVRFRTLPQDKIESEMRRAEDLAYVLLNKSEPTSEPGSTPVLCIAESVSDNGAALEFFPRSGWLRGSVADIATAIGIRATPISKIDAAADLLEKQIETAAQQLEAAIKARPSIGTQIEAILFQSTGKQTSRMAMLILTNAFVFQSVLAGKPEMETVMSLKRMLSDTAKRLQYEQVIAGWNSILKVNYRPIFHVAKRLIEAIATDDEFVDRLLATLCDTAKELVDQRLTHVHELAGTVFQRLIVDRKYVKANYTRPESAALLSTLVLPKTQRDLSELKVADFACGTGSLLHSVYRRLLELHEQAGGKGSRIHTRMIEKNLVGCDIMPNASHLTAALLTSTYPDLKIGTTRIHTMPYGRQKDGSYALGALDLFDVPEGTLPLPMMGPEVQQVGGADDTQVMTHHEFRHNEFDIIVLNPPFTRPDSDANSSVPKAVFKGSHREKQEEQAMRRARGKKRWRVGNGNAGLPSDFVDLADRMLKAQPGSRMGLILPVTCLVSPHWRKVRNMWATEYQNVIVMSIADAEGENCAFSADTSMAECMLVATKEKNENTGRGTFISLNQRPQSVLEALEIANIIHRFNNTRRLEDGPSGGTPLKIGNDVLGYALNCPLNVDSAWEAVRIKEMALIQSAYRLAKGEIWMPTQGTPLEIPICSVGDIAAVGAHHRDIREPGKRGAFDLETGYTQTDLYPSLWNLNAPRQRALVVEPDSHLVPRAHRPDKVQRILARNGRLHFSVDIGFSANSLSVLFTEKPAIGGSSLPNVILEKPIYDYAWTLWCNSTLGILLHWAHSSKQQPGRGRGSRTALLQMPTLDVRCLSEAAVTNAERIFDTLKHQRMLPFNEAAHDPVRQDLDHRLLREVLSITTGDVHKALHRLRELLCGEPSIHGGKKSRCNLKRELVDLQTRERREE